MGHSRAAHSICRTLTSICLIKAGSASPVSRGLPFLNFATITAFLTWFGATGFLLMRYSPLAAIATIMSGIVAGLLGSALIFWFMLKLLRHDRELDPDDYRRVGALGRVSSPIREGGTGEIIFSQAGSRTTCGARSEDGQALPRGTEIIVTRYERGIAYVARWREMVERQAATRTHNLQS